MRSKPSSDRQEHGPGRDPAFQAATIAAFPAKGYATVDEARVLWKQGDHAGPLADLPSFSGSLSYTRPLHTSPPGVPRVPADGPGHPGGRPERHGGARVRAGAGLQQGVRRHPPVQRPLDLRLLCPPQGGAQGSRADEIELVVGSGWLVGW